ncbi:flagellar basal body rod protein FlgB [Kineothrix sp. MSJ-39]|uniref:flagellar basal body rod protein FlgB n=1 Tax=Kineothrix sp. MSJ-39 TaxID=2841533 RepID=UPI00033D3FC4|nr:flagellar basal body rod protein FlgB [Kineothrix sp. MSJ-39]MEE1438844.1 flagellar basal body rod protein FlgB [Lachnospiraceae bacterium]OLA30363.1 MAG: flagellar basal-body rod protein FlgB [Firmicutes bacterium CAG_194_44_15]CCZ27499.1 flagellar basal body rod protein FlgB [Firmicutes bacterium CAG:194]MBU5429356.1 flagellar basal body rod protein FlgB [Kineothrix sp. MSJ-39]HCI17617.1 flagellar basal body rod protein FlgB [Lachnospiraceae bacterium]
MINSNIYDYVNVLDKAADASWMRQEAISNNIANVNTPGYKRQDVAFEDSLQEAISNSRYRSTDEKVANLSKADLRIRSYTDSSGFSYRLDGNNVDIDTENAALARNQLKYNALVDSINHEFSMIKAVTQ